MTSVGGNYDDLPVVEDLSNVRVDDDDLSAVKKRLLKAKKLKSSKVNGLLIILNHIKYLPV